MKLTITTALMTTLVAFAAPAQAQSLVIATGGTGGTYYPVGVGIAKIVSEALDGVNVDAVTSGGSTENVRLIGRDEVDMGITNGVVGSLAVNGIFAFDNDPQIDLRSLFSLWGNTEHHVALTANTDTGTVADIASLDGKYNIGGRQSGARTAASLMLDALGIDAENDVDLEFLASYSEAAGAMQDRRIVAANMGAGIPVAAVTELYASLGDDVTVLSFTDEQLEQIDANYPGLYYRVEIPAGTYPGQDDPIATAEYANLMVADADVDEETVYQFVKAVFDNLDAVHAIHPAAEAIKPATALNGLSVPLHAGAIRFYEERGVVVPDRLRPAS